MTLQRKSMRAFRSWRTLRARTAFLPGRPLADRKIPDGTANADLTAAADLQQQQDAADQTEKEVKQAEGSGQGD